MGDRRKLLLAAIALTALYYKVTAESVTVLDMAPDAVDDRYEGCRKEALDTFVLSDLLQQELNRSDGFQKAWNAKQCSKLIPGGTKEHTAALLAYANGDEVFKKNFNEAVETLGTNVSTYENHFHFKSLHFLLMDSMTLNPKCRTLYVVPEEKYTANKGSQVRFGRFTQVYTDYLSTKKLQDMEDLVILNITSCFFTNLGSSICSEEEGTALLSPAEVFTVEQVNSVETDDTSYTEIALTHSKWNSSHNCYMFSRSPADVSTQWLVLALVALSFFSFSC